MVGDLDKFIITISNCCNAMNASLDSVLAGSYLGWCGVVGLVLLSSHLVVGGLPVIKEEDSVPIFSGEIEKNLNNL